MPPSLLPGEGFTSRMFCPPSMAFFSHHATASSTFRYFRCPRAPGEKVLGADQLRGFGEDDRPPFRDQHVRCAADRRIRCEARGVV